MSFIESRVWTREMGLDCAVAGIARAAAERIRRRSVRLTEMVMLRDWWRGFLFEDWRLT